jgi:hypothetical protein
LSASIIEHLLCQQVSIMASICISFENYLVIVHPIVFILMNKLSHPASSIEKFSSSLSSVIGSRLSDQLLLRN